ncbi:MAG TPA: hypothetical protein VNM16_08890 [Bacillota bacterium]|nr:hypothetical protein [Bacillota bacterium]
MPSSDVVDREDFLRRLTWELEQGHAILLAAPRRTGKSSIALCALQGLRGSGHLTASVDLFALTSVRDIALALADAIVVAASGGWRAEAARAGDRLRQALAIDRVRVALAGLEVDIFREPSRADPSELLDRALGLAEALAERAGTRFVLLLDEFQEAHRIGGDDLLRRLRATMQAQRRTSYLFCGSQAGVMRALFGESRQAFYRFAYPLELPPVPSEAWRHYIVAKMETLGRIVTDGAVDVMLDCTGGHPYDTMAVASRSLYFAERFGRRAVDADLAREAAAAAERELATFLEAELAAMPGRARDVLARIALGAPLYAEVEAPGSVARALRSLVADGLITRTGHGRYEIGERMLASYLRARG